MDIRRINEKEFRLYHASGKFRDAVRPHRLLASRIKGYLVRLRGSGACQSRRQRWTARGEVVIGVAGWAHAKTGVLRALLTFIFFPLL